jgi:peroxiredoxin family protein
VIAVIFASREPARLYTGLSLLVSAASEGEAARGLVAFDALAPLLDPDLEARALRREAAPAISADGRATFARTLAGLRDAAAQLPDCRIWACAAAAETTGASRAAIDERLDGVLSTPRFLREIGDARLVVL